MSKGTTQVSDVDSAAEVPVLNTARWGRDDEHTPVYAVVSAVAAVEGVDPVELPSLYHAIDPEALNDLFTSRSESAVERVTFRYAGYSIVVRENGEVQVRST